MTTSRHSLLVAICAALTASAASAQEVTISVGFGPVIDTPYGQGHSEWQRLVAEESNGAMALELFPADQLGSGKQMLDQMLLGEPVCYSTDASFFAELGVPDMSIVQAPFLFETWDQAERLFASDWWTEQEAALAEKGVTVVADNWRYGERQTLTTRPVIHPGDFAGLKIRVPQAAIYVKTFEHLGATPTPMALGEVYTSLQQGVIDGLENPLSVIDGGKYQEAAKYLLLDNHMRTVNLMACSSALYDSLTAEQQDILRATAVEAGAFQNARLAESDAATLEKLQAEGVTVTEADYAEFAGAVTSFYEDPAFSSWSDGLHQKVLEIMQAE